MRTTDISPCGINCSLCIAFQREKKKCYGCNGPEEYKPKHCITCSIKNCAEFEGNNKRFCYKCGKYPCERIISLDKRYRIRYKMSILENQKFIKENGINKFVRTEIEKWKCIQCGGLLCVHRDICPDCGAKNPVFYS